MNPMSWSDRNEVICNSGVTELWACGRALNNRGTILVYVYKGRRYRADHWTKTTADELVGDDLTMKFRRIDRGR